MANKSSQTLPDIDLDFFKIDSNDKVSRKLLMLIEGNFGIGVKKSIEKYDYTEQRYYQLLKAFQKDGSEALIDKNADLKEIQKETKKRYSKLFGIVF
jgi:hypothetical protein